MSEQPEPLQNDPDRAAGSLVPDARGESVREHPGGAFDPRTPRAGAPRGDDTDPEPDVTSAATSDPKSDPVSEAGAGGARASGPGEEIDKLR